MFKLVYCPVSLFMHNIHTWFTDIIYSKTQILDIYPRFKVRRIKKNYFLIDVCGFEHIRVYVRDCMCWWSYKNVMNWRIKVNEINYLLFMIASLIINLINIAEDRTILNENWINECQQQSLLKMNKFRSYAF